MCDFRSTDVGRHFLRYAADRKLNGSTRLGGSPELIFADASLDLDGDTAGWAIFFNSGEMVPRLPIGVMPWATG